MNPTERFKKEELVIAKDVFCPLCLWDEKFKNNFDLEWHMLKFHGKRSFMDFMKDNGSFSRSSTRRNIIEKPFLVELKSYRERNVFQHRTREKVWEQFTPRSTVRPLKSSLLFNEAQGARKKSKRNVASHKVCQRPEKLSGSTDGDKQMMLNTRMKKKLILSVNSHCCNYDLEGQPSSSMNIEELGIVAGSSNKGKGKNFQVDTIVGKQSPKVCHEELEPAVGKCHVHEKKSCLLAGKCHEHQKHGSQLARNHEKEGKRYKKVEVIPNTYDEYKADCNDDHLKLENIEVKETSYNEGEENAKEISMRFNGNSSSHASSNATCKSNPMGLSIKESREAEDPGNLSSGICCSVIDACTNGNSRVLEKGESKRGSANVTVMCDSDQCNVSEKFDCLNPNAQNLKPQSQNQGAVPLCFEADSHSLEPNRDNAEPTSYRPHPELRTGVKPEIYQSTYQAAEKQKNRSRAEIPNPESFTREGFVCKLVKEMTSKSESSEIKGALPPDGNEAVVSDHKGTKAFPDAAIINKKIPNNSSIEQYGECLFNIGDIAINVYDKTSGHRPAAEQFSYENELNDMKMKLKEISEKYNKTELLIGQQLQLEREGSQAKQLHKNDEDLQQINEQLLQKLKGVYIEMDDLEASLNDCKRVGHELKCKETNQREYLKRISAEKDSIFKEKLKIDDLLLSTNEQLKDLGKKLQETSCELARKNEAVSRLEKLLDDKQKAMENMVEICNEEAEAVEKEKEASELKKNYDSPRVKRKGIFTLFCRKKQEDKRGKGVRKLSKKKKMRIIISDLDEELFLLKKELSTRKRGFALMQQLKIDQDQEIGLFREQVLKNIDDLNMQLKNSKSNNCLLKSEITNKEKEMEMLNRKHQLILKENETFSKEFVVLQNRVADLEWQVEFENSYSCEMEENFIEYYRLIEKKVENDNRRMGNVQERNKSFQTELTKRNQELKALKYDFIKEKKTKENLERENCCAQKKLLKYQGNADPTFKTDHVLLQHIKNCFKEIKGEFANILTERSGFKFDNALMSKPLEVFRKQATDMLRMKLDSFTNKMQSSVMESRDVLLKAGKDKLVTCIEDLRKAEKIKEGSDVCEDVKQNELLERILALQTKLKESDSKIEDLIHAKKELAEKYENCLKEKEALKNCEKKLVETEDENRELLQNIKSLKIKLDSERDERLSKTVSFKKIDKEAGELIQENESLREKLKLMEIESKLQSERQKNIENSEVVSSIKIEKELDQLKCENAKLKDKIKLAESDLEQNVNVSSLEKRNFTLEEELSSIHAELAALKKEKEEETVSKNKEIEKLRGERLEYEKAIENMNAEYSNSQEKFQCLKDDLDNGIKKQKDSEILLEMKDSEIHKLVLEKKDLIAKLTQKGLEIDATIKEFDSLRKKNEELIKKEDSCKENHAYSEEKLKSYEKEIKEKNLQIEDLEEEVESFRKELEEECIEHREMVDDLQRELETKIAKIKNLEGKVTAIERARSEDIQSKDRSNTELQKHCSDLEAKCNQQKIRVEELCNEKSALKKDRKEFEGMAEKYKMKVIELERKLEFLDKKSLEKDSVFGQMITNLEDDRKYLEEKVEQLVAENKSLREGLQLMLGYEQSAETGKEETDFESMRNPLHAAGNMVINEKGNDARPLEENTATFGKSWVQGQPKRINGANYTLQKFISTEDDRREPLLDDGIKDLKFEYEDNSYSEAGIQPQKSFMGIRDYTLNCGSALPSDGMTLMGKRDETSDASKKKKGKKNGSAKKKKTKLKLSEAETNDDGPMVITDLEKTVRKDPAFCHYPTFGVLNQKVKLEGGESVAKETKQMLKSTLTSLPKDNSFLFGNKAGLTSSSFAPKKGPLPPLPL